MFARYDTRSNGPGISGVHSRFREYYNVHNDEDDMDAGTAEEHELYDTRREALIEHYIVMGQNPSLQLGLK